MPLKQTPYPGAGLDLAYGPDGLVVGTVEGARVRVQRDVNVSLSPPAPQLLHAPAYRIAVASDGAVAHACQILEPDRGVVCVRGVWKILPGNLWGQAPVGITATGTSFRWASVINGGATLRIEDEDGTVENRLIPGDGTSQGILYWQDGEPILADSRKSVDVDGIAVFHGTSVNGWIVGKRNAPASVLLGKAGYHYTVASGQTSEPRLAVQGDSVSVGFSQAGSKVVTLTPPYPVDTPVVVPTIGRRMWLGWFEFEPASLPGNSELWQVASWQWALMAGGKKHAVYVSGEPDGSLASLEVNIGRVKTQGVPIIAYWPRSLQGGRLPRGASWTGVEAYRLKDESLLAFETRVRAAVARCPKAALVCQCYTSNALLTADLASLVPVYARIARDMGNVVAVLAFSGSGRPTGLQDHPSVRPLWNALAAGIPEIEDEMNKPGVTITEWHEIRPNVLVARAHDRNNPDHYTTEFLIENGNLRVRMTNAAGMDISNATARKVL